MKNKYQILLEGDLASEKFVREALSVLEADIRETALLALADWAKLKLIAQDMFAAVASLQRPSWGMWNGLITALKNARKNVLRTGSAEVREKVEQAELLKGLLEQLNMAFDAELSKALKPLGELTRTSIPKKPKLAFILTLPINLRNRIAHDVPSADNWWDEAAAALRPLIDFHTETHPLHQLSDDSDREYPAPWFLIEEGEVCAFNGLARDMAVIYVSANGESRYSAECSQSVLLEFQSLLGKTESQETDFRKLLSKLAPEEIKGVMMGDYLVGKPVGAGGFATVHMARQLSTGRKVAVKILRDGMGEEIAQRFQQEARFLSRLEHPKIVAVYGYGEETWSAPRAFSLSDEEWFQTFSKGAPVKSYIAMEWVEGKTLDDFFDQQEDDQRPSMKTLANWFSQSAAALAAVHATGLIHRDIKPANLMVTEDGQIKLMDFGIARATSDQRTVMTEAGRTFGTPAYMSPEQIRAADLEAEVGPATDVYSLCATFYELLTGKRFYGHGTENIETIKTRKLAGQRPERPRLLTKGLPWELETIVMGGLESDIADRYSSMDDLKWDIDHYLHDEPIEYERPSVWRRAQLAYRRNRVVFNLVAAFMIVAAVGLAAYIYTVISANNRLRKQIAATLVSKLHVSVDQSVDEFQSQIEDLREYRKLVVPKLEEKLDPDEPKGEPPEEAARVYLGKQRADAAIALFNLQHPQSAVEFLPFKKDPETLTQFVHRCKDRGVTVKQLFDQLVVMMDRDHANEAIVVYGLLLALGEFEKEHLIDLGLKDKIEKWYKEDPNSAIHSACRWLFRRVWPKNDESEVDELDDADEELVSANLEDAYDSENEWFVLKVGADYLTFVVFPPGEFDMGSPQTESDRADDETCHRVKISRRFAVCAREFDKAQVYSWQNAVKECQSLTKRVEDQCYFLDDERQACESESPDWQFDLSRPGFRLPTEAEWEYACRAGTVTQFSFGSDASLLEKYANYGGGDRKAFRDGEPRPNPRGLFHIHGNVSEWCHDRYSSFKANEGLLEDPVGPDKGRKRIVRGGNKGSEGSQCRSAVRGAETPTDAIAGFRLCVTLDTKKRESASE